MTKRNEDGTPHPLRWTQGKWKAGLLGGAYAIFDERGYIKAMVLKKYDAIIMAKSSALYEILQEILDNAVVNYVYREKAEKVMAKARGEEVG